MTLQSIVQTSSGLIGKTWTTKAMLNFLLQDLSTFSSLHSTVTVSGIWHHWGRRRLTFKWGHQVRAKAYSKSLGSEAYATHTSVHE